MKSFPGQLSSKDQIASMLRVNLAGEYGAKRIYEGQLAVLKNSSVAPVLEHMKAQELTHLKAFESLVVQNQVRPTLLHPLWHVAGYALGAATAYLGEKAAMACTAAVEDVIDQHYEKQLNLLGDQNPELSQLIYTCQQEELEHRDLALEQGAREAPAYPLLTHVIKSASRLAIWLSERV
ncbi:MAG TPA: demethoxyubiquinone hydroxylase family protein [Alphaproteobacteria bacterium]|nr:demethoxyubiquinone hydroxylase family protein [Alphaproteobacteria bacterium]